MGSGRSQRWQSGWRASAVARQKPSGNGLTCKPPTPPWLSPTRLMISHNYIMILSAQGGRGREWVQQGPCPPTALHHSPPPPNRCRKTGHSFRAPRRPFRAPRHPQPHTHAKNTLVSMWERGEAFGGPWGHGDRRSHGPWGARPPNPPEVRTRGSKKCEGPGRVDLPLMVPRAEFLYS